MVTCKYSHQYSCILEFLLKNSVEGEKFKDTETIYIEFAVVVVVVAVVVVVVVVFPQYLIVILEEGTFIK